MLYISHQLVFDSDLPFEFLDEATGSPDLSLVAGPAEIDAQDVAWFARWNHPSGDEWMRFGRAPGFVVLSFPRIATFRINDGMDRVEVLNHSLAPTKTISHLFVDQVIPLLLAERGNLVLHGSAVNWGHSAALFLGPSGSGKSTLATALATRGAELISDDCARVVAGEVGYSVARTEQRMAARLWPDAAQRLTPDLARHSHEVAHYNAKRRIFIGAEAQQPLGPLSEIFILSRQDASEAAAVKQMTKADAFFELIGFSYMLTMDAATTLYANFVSLCDLTDRVRVSALHYPRSFDRLEAVCALVEERVR